MAGVMLPLIVAVLTINDGFTILDKHPKMLFGVVIAFIALIAVATVVPHVIIAFRERKSADWQRGIGYLKQEIETLKRNQVAKS